MTYIPDHLDFKVAFEPTKMHDKKYVINEDTGERIDIEIVDDTIDGEVQLNVKEFYND